MRSILSGLAAAVGGATLSGSLLLTAPPLVAQTTTAPKIYKGLEISVASVENAQQVSLKDCPPGANTVGSTAKPGEQFAVITLNFKVLPAFKPTTFRRPVLTDASGKNYNTAVSLADVGKVPEFSCAIPFRVPSGTKVKSIQIDDSSIDLTAVQTKQP
jgi:hypothetical protein